MSGLFMDYGDDWPPPLDPPQPPVPGRRPRSVWRRCIWWIGVFAVIWAGGALAVHLLGPMSLTFPTPGDAHTTYATTTMGPSPHPATTGGHPGPADRRPTRGDDQR